MNYGSRIQYDGTFEIANVPPGRYTLQARGNDNDAPQFASQPLTVGSDDIEVSVAPRQQRDDHRYDRFSAGPDRASGFFEHARQRAFD